MDEHEEVTIHGMKIRLVPIEDISIADTNMRDSRLRDEKVIEQISQNIQELEQLRGIEQGLLNPPLATPNNEIFAGGYRLMALKRIDKTVVPLRIMDVPEDIQIILSLSEGMHHPLDRVDVGRGIQKLRQLDISLPSYKPEEYAGKGRPQSSKWTMDKISKVLGYKSARALYDIATMDKIEPDFIDKLDTRPEKFSVHSKRQMYKLKETLGIPKEKEDEFIDKISKMTTDKLDNVTKWASEGMPVDLNKEKKLSEEKKDYVSVELKVERTLYSRIRQYCIKHEIDPERFFWKASNAYLEQEENA